MSEREILTVTEAALEKILDLRASEDNAEDLALRIEVTGVQGVDFSYDLAFEVLSQDFQNILKAS